MVWFDEQMSNSENTHSFYTHAESELAVEHQRINLKRSVVHLVVQIHYDG